MNYTITIVLVLKAHTCTKSAKSNPKSPKSFNKGDIQGRTLWREKPEKDNEKKKRKKDAVSEIQTLGR